MSGPAPGLPLPGEALRIGSGAIGSCLRDREADGGPVELLNLSDPRRVRELHAAYRAAGSGVLVTNTFGAHRVGLDAAGSEAEVAAVNRQGVALAREAADGAAVWGSMGPLHLGLQLEDYSDADLRAAYEPQAQALTGADALVLETFLEPREAAAALAAARATGLPVVFQCGHPGRGAAALERLDRLLDLALGSGVGAVGINCCPPGAAAALVRYLAGRAGIPVTAAPNAGNPRIERGAVTYEFGPGDLARIGEELAAAGAALIGGCCGTTPAHIRALAAALADRRVVSIPRVERAVRRAPAGSAGPHGPNRVRTLVNGTGCVISVELRAERRRTVAELIEAAGQLVAAGADLLDVPDNPGAGVGRDAAVTAGRLQQAVEVPCLPHKAATQANLLQVQSSLIGCGDLGLEGILAVTGDPPSIGAFAHLAHPVADVKSSVELLRLVRELRAGRLANGEGVAGGADLCAGCAFGQPTPAQVRWLRRKIEAGAEFVFSQPVFDAEGYDRLLQAVAGCGIRVFPGVLPLTSVRTAQALAGGRIPGVSVPAGVVAALSRFEQAEDQRRCGLELAANLVRRAGADGALYLVMPFGAQAVADSAALVAMARAAAV